MTVTIELNPAEEARLLAAAQRAGLGPSDLARRIVTDHLPCSTGEAQIDPTLALFEQWGLEDALMTREEIDSEQRLWNEFEAGVNETRQALGMRLL